MKKETLVGNIGFLIIFFGVFATYFEFLDLDTRLMIIFFGACGLFFEIYTKTKRGNHENFNMNKIYFIRFFP